MTTAAEAEVKDLMKDLERRYNKAMLTGSVVSQDDDQEGGAGQLQQMQRAKGKLKAELRQSQRRNNELERDLQQCQVALGNTRSSLLQAQTELAATNNRCATLEFQQKSLQQDQTAASRHVHTPPSTIQELHMKIRELQTQLNIEQAANSRQNTELKDAHRRYLSAQKAVADGTAQLAKMEQSLEQSRVQSVRKEEQHQKQVEQLQAALAVASEELKAAKAAGQTTDDAFSDERAKNKGLQRALASAQLGALLQVRNTRQQAKWLNVWRMQCFSKKDSHHKQLESQQQLCRLEASYKQEIGQLQARYDHLQTNYRANVVEHLQHVKIRTACRRAMSIWKAGTIRALSHQPFQAETCDTGIGPPSPTAMGGDTVKLQTEIDTLQEMLKSKDVEISSQHSIQTTLKIASLSKLLHGKVHSNLHRAFSRWHLQSRRAAPPADSVADASNESVLFTKVTELQQLLAHLAFAWKSQHTKQTAFHAWKDIHLRSMITTLTSRTHSSISNALPVQASTADRFRQNAPNLWRRWRLDRGRGVSNAVQTTTAEILNNSDAVVSLATGYQPNISDSPLPLRNARRSWRLNNKEACDEVPDEELTNEALMLRKVLFLSPQKHWNGHNTSRSAESPPEVLSDESGSLPATCEYVPAYDFVHEIYHEVQEQQRQSVGAGRDCTPASSSRSRIHGSTQVESPSVTLHTERGVGQAVTSHWEVTKSSKVGTPNPLDLTTSSSPTEQVRTLHQLVARVGEEGMIQDMVARLRVRIQETVYQVAEKLLACVDADFRDYKIPRPKVRPMSKAMRADFCELVRIEASAGTLRWLLVLYLRAYATILREQAGQALPPSLRTTPIEAYRRLLRDLTVDLAQDVAEFRATRVLETSHYHRTGKFQNNGHQVLYLDTGAGPREYWKVISHSKKVVQGDWSKDDAEHELWRLAVCVRCQTRSEGLSLLRNDPQRQLVDKMMYTLVLYYTFVVIWEHGDILANEPNGIGL